jgi:hypothetical protein
MFNWSPSTRGSSFIFFVAAVKELARGLDTSQTMGVKAMQCLESRVSFDRIYSLSLEKVNDEELLVAHQK